MLNLAATRIVKALNRDVAAGTEVRAEGTPLVYVMEGGVGKVKPCAGAAGERFAGFSITRTLVPLTAAIVEVVDLAAGIALYKVKKSNVIAGQIRVEAVAADGTLTDFTLAADGDAGLTAGKYFLDGTTITFNAADAGKVFKISYRYVPSAPEAVDMFGVGDVGGVSATAYTNNIGIITEGDISTSEFDAAVDWTAGGDVYLGANGLLTLTSAGGNTKLDNVNVVSAPGAQYPFLTVSLG